MKNCIVALCIMLFAACNQEAKSLKTGYEGKSAPSLDLLLVDSSTYFNISNIKSGKPSVLFFFSPSCPFCNAEMESIVKGMDQTKDIDFYVFTPFPFKEMKEFYKGHKLDQYSNVFTGFDYKNAFATHFSVEAIPFTVIYNKNGKMLKAFAGSVTSKQIREVAKG